VPALFALGYRLTIPETPRFTFDVEKDYDKAIRDAKTVLQMNQSDATGRDDIDLEPLHRSSTIRLLCINDSDRQQTEFICWKHKDADC
jgi:hypothetical protein